MSRPEDIQPMCRIGDSVSRWVTVWIRRSLLQSNVSDWIMAEYRRIMVQIEPPNLDPRHCCRWSTRPWDLVRLDQVLL